MRKTQKGITNGKRARRKQTITAQDALSMLESAVSYCQSAGLNVGAANGDNGTLGLFIPGAHYILMDNGARAAFRLGAFYPTREETRSVSAHAKRADAAERNGTRSVTAHSA